MGAADGRDDGGGVIAASLRMLAATWRHPLGGRALALLLALCAFAAVVPAWWALAPAWPTMGAAVALAVALLVQDTAARWQAPTQED